MERDMKKFNESQLDVVKVEVLQEWSKYAKCRFPNGQVKNVKALEPDSFSGLEGKELEIIYMSGREWDKKVQRFEEISECVFNSDLGQGLDTLKDGTELQIPVERKKKV